MALKFHESPFHVTHDKKVASRMAMKVDLSVLITKAIEKNGWTQQEAANELEIPRSRVSEIKNSKIELYSLDSLMDIMDKFGFEVKLTTPCTVEANIVIEQPIAKVY
ncbi:MULTISPECIES: helix-turn-helix domain-containing protein [Vibrio]|uniref:helix-turn-helix domain-containing protein n=1 Tax=Vibrio TaxID=662 RepID=UPI000C83D157|nr:MULTISPECIES: XRE family transcriptional regulator [Vibrio]PML07995.1 transcriptional regulator [Vibrio lentus]TQL28803.1 putative XRE-type DNA-binding protein [Vibrio crassostreae]